MRLRDTLLGNTFLRSPDEPVGGAAAPVESVVDAAAVVEPAAVVEAPVVVEPVIPAGEPAASVAEVVADAVPAKLDAHATETLLEAAGKPEPAKAEEVKAEPAKPAEAAAPKIDKDGKPVVEAAPAVDPAKAAEAPAPVVYDLKLPETIKVDNDLMTDYKGFLAENKLSPEIGQALLDKYTAASQKMAEHLLAEQHRAFEDTRKGWRDEVMADAEIGGAGHKTALTKIAQMRDMLVQEKDRPAFDNFLRVTGAGDHPMFLKILHTAHRWLGEPASPAIVGTPAKTNGQAPGRGRGLRGMYGDNRAARGST